MENISGFGMVSNILASNTFPVGLDLTQFADDADPLDIPSLQIADKAMGLNGDLIIFSKANPIIVTMNVIPNSFTDDNLQILFQANRVGKGKTGARDIITMVVTYPSGNFVTFTTGAITDGVPALPVASSGRMKSKAYSFAFENMIGGL